MPVPGRFDSASIRTLLEMMDDGVVLHDANGIIVACNPAAERILHVRRSDLEGSTSLFPRVAVSDTAGFSLAPESEPVWRALRTKQPTPVQSVRFRLEGGAEVWAELKSTPVRGRPGREVQGAITKVRDVGADRALESRLRGRQRMEIMGRLAGGVAHDFNNLLTVILGYNSMLLDGLDPADPRWREADEVRKAAQRGADLTRQLLAISRGQIVESRVLDMNHVLTDMAPMLRQIVGPSIRVDIQEYQGAVAVRADYGQLEQLFLNLVINARDAMPSGGSVRIEVKVIDLDETFVADHPGSRPGRFALMQVADEGCGMDDLTQGRIFEPFFTTKPHDKGTGLGLATVYGIVKQHGGYIDVESAPGRGATFRLFLPLSGETPLPMAIPARREPVRRAAGTLLLVVEDEQVRRLARRVLQRSGYEVMDESNGLRALALADQHPGAITAVVADLVLPGMGGIDLARRIVSRRPGTRVLFLSGYTDGSFEIPMLPMKEAHLLAKPFRPQALVEKLRDVLAQGEGVRKVEVSG